MNPEIRFRVPEHVLSLARERAVELGLDRRRGRTGGVSELARGALYCALDLALPGDLHQLQQQAFARIRGLRSSLSSGELRVEVHHRVNQEYRKTEALRRGRPVAARATTTFEFEVGQLPHFVAPYVLLSEDGYPYVELNLEGALSPRQDSLGELVSATDQATLAELERTLTELQQAQKERQKRQEAREARQTKGRQVLENWARRHGSELLKARLDGGFEWIGLAAEEHALHYLAQVGVEEPERVKTTTSLGAPHGARHGRPYRGTQTSLEPPSASSYRNLQPQPEPTLRAIRRLEQLRRAEDSGLRFTVVLCQDSDGRLLEGIRIAVQTPLPDWLYFLTDLHPI